MDQVDDLVVCVLMACVGAEACPGCAWVLVRGNVPVNVLQFVWSDLAQLKPSVASDPHALFNSLPRFTRPTGEQYAVLHVRVNIARQIWPDVPIDLRPAIDQYAAPDGQPHAQFHVADNEVDRLRRLYDRDVTYDALYTLLNYAYRLSDGMLTLAEMEEVRYGVGFVNAEPDERALGQVVLDQLDALMDRLGRDLMIEDQEMQDQVHAAYTVLSQAMATLPPDE
jgi:hypothetical protein